MPGERRLELGESRVGERDHLTAAVLARPPAHDEPLARQAGNEDDVFIPPDEINGAMQGDQVLVELAPPRGDGRRLGRVARIIQNTASDPVRVAVALEGYRLLAAECA